MSALRKLSVPLTSGHSSFVLPLRKLVLEYSESWPSSKGMRAFLASEKGLLGLAKENGGVEFVVRRKDNAHPHLRGLYANGRTKTICVSLLPAPSIHSKSSLLLASSGAQIQALKRPYVQSENESVKGIWSAFHKDGRTPASPGR